MEDWWQQLTKDENELIVMPNPKWEESLDYTKWTMEDNPPPPNMPWGFMRYAYLAHADKECWFFNTLLNHQDPPKLLTTLSDSKDNYTAMIKSIIETQLNIETYSSPKLWNLSNKIPLTSSGKVHYSLIKKDFQRNKF